MQIKKILLLLLVLIGLFYITPISFAECPNGIDENFKIGEALDKCLEGTDLVDSSNAGIESGGISTIIKKWVENIALYLAVFAVGSIVYGGLMMTLSTGDDEKIKKSKDIVKWGLIGFLGVISASAIINLVVKIMYSI